MDALDLLPEPDVVLQRRRWTILCSRVAALRAYRGAGELACPPPEHAPLWARMLWAECCPQVKELLSVIRCGELDDLIGGAHG